jgi:Flp pilus assembly pilin Flp
MGSLAKGFMHEETAEDLIEYGLLAAFVAAIAVACIIADPLGLAPAVEGAYQDAIDALNSI